MPPRRSRNLRLGRRQKSPITVKHLLLVAFIITALMVASDLAHAKVTDEDQDHYSNVINVEDSKTSLRSIIDSHEKVVLFWEQATCSGCKLMLPSLLKVANETPDVLFVRVHIDKIFNSNMDYAFALMEEYNVVGTPTLIAYYNGEEVSRQVGIFPGDQYESLKSWIQEAYTRAPTANITTRDEYIPAPVKALALGLLAAFAPCSVPMIAAFSAAQAKTGSNNIKKIGLIYMGLSSAVMTFGFIMTLLYIASFVVHTVNIYSITLTFLGAFILAWGLSNIAGHEPLLRVRSTPKSAILLPILGLQCSIPFMILAIATVGSNPVNALLSGVFFALGYSLPYALAASGSTKIASKIARLSGSRGMLIAQGLVLVLAGAYVIYEASSSGYVTL